MKKSLRLSSIAVAGIAALVLAATALPSSSGALHVQRLHSGLSAHAYQPLMVAQQSSYKVGAATNVGFVFAIAPTDDPTAKITTFSPAGYTSSTPQAPGTVIGKAFAIVRAGALGGADLTLSGNVVVGDPTDAQLMAAYAQCKNSTDPSTPQAIWVLNTMLNGQALQVPAFVNTVGPYLVQELCLPPPPAAAFQAQLWLANYTINGVFHNAGASNAYQWVSDFTPYAGTTPNPAGTTEFRTYTGLPSSLTFKKGKSKKKSLFAFTGRMRIGGVNPAGIKLDRYQGSKSQPAPNFLSPSQNNVREILFSKPAGFKGHTAKLKSKGTYSFSVKKPKKSKKKTFFQMRLDPFWGFSSCSGPSPTGLPIPCLGEGLAPLTSAQIKR
jgi:hypothetical protein